MDRPTAGAIRGLAIRMVVPKMKKTSVLFVCMGNICRSPTAEGVFRRLVEDAGLRQGVSVDSAGTHDYHIGKSPDKRAQQAAGERGYDLSGLRGRQVALHDFQRFDLVLAMDRENLVNLQRLCPVAHRHKVRLFMDFSERYPGQEVPDPYYGGSRGFEHVLEMVEDAARGLLAHLRRDEDGSSAA